MMCSAFSVTRKNRQMSIKIAQKMISLEKGLILINSSNGKSQIYSTRLHSGFAIFFMMATSK